MKAHLLFPTWSVWRSVALFLVCAAIVSGCGSENEQSAGVGTGGTGTLARVALDVTDTPAIDYAHVYVTVTGVAFHTDASAAFLSNGTNNATGWQIVNLATPKTVDLAQLTNGTMYADLNGNSSLFDGMNLPVGNYRQIRIFLASTEDAYAGSTPGLIYNNEVQLNGDAAHYPLRIPSSDEGIKVLPESSVAVTSGSNVRLALDFNLGDDVVQISPNGATEFIFKPRLGYFDMGSVGSVKGSVSFSNLSTSGIEVKAEQVKSGANYRIVRRATSVDKTTGRFNLYPLPVFGNATTATYDILIRGRKVQTTIIKGVKVHKGTSLSSGAVDLGTVAMQPGTEFTAQLATAIHPTGSWINFYQTIAGDAVPYEVRNRHLDPYTGRFGKNEELSTGPIRKATFIQGQPLVFTSDTTSQGVFSAVADAADFFGRGDVLSGISAAAGGTAAMTMSAANYPRMDSAATAGKINCAFDMALLGTGTGAGMGMGNRNIGNPSKGQIFVTHGGMIIDSIGDLTGDTTVNASMRAGGGAANSVGVINIPSNAANAVYGVYALGWGNGFIAAGKTFDIDMRKEANATVTIRLK
ncbi:MAG TPA: DUF4382 domain-containing protein [Dongiaceae bacterium]|nr:DUF4382 domain-containing protein [Dongiaceae bacterium]